MWCNWDRHVVAKGSSLAVLSLFAAPLALAQTVHRVGPGALPNVRAALAIAAPGDVVELASGDYESFTLDVGVVLRAGTCANPHVTSGGRVTVALPPGQRANVYDVDLMTGLTVTTGAASFERCDIDGPGAALVVDGGSVVLQHCRIAAVSTVAAEACVVHGGDLAAQDTVFTGVADAVSTGGRGLVLAGGTTNLNRCTVNGGAGTAEGRDAVAVEGGRLWLADCTVRGGGGGTSSGGAGVRNSNGEQVRVARTSIGGGAGARTGDPTIGPVQSGARLLGVSASQGGIALGSVFSITSRGERNWPVFLFMSADFGSSRMSLFEQTVWLPNANDFVYVGFGLIGEGVPFRYDTAVPVNLRLRNNTFWFHAFAIDPASPRIQAGVPVGGVVH